MKPDLVKNLFEFQDLGFRDFHSKLLPGIDKDKIIGIKTPVLRKLAKELIKNGEYIEFINDLPHAYYDENQLHAFIISELKDYDLAIKETEKFLPFVDNWTTCDQLNPKPFKSNVSKLEAKIFEWLKSDDIYTVRFCINMLIKYYLTDNFSELHFEILCSIKTDEYYVNMALAWYFATALAFQYGTVLPYLTEHRLNPWVHNKTIQKARESYRITIEQKEFLKTLKK